MTDKTKRITIALDPATYKALKQLGLDTERSNQSMGEEAVRDFLKKWDGA